MTKLHKNIFFGATVCVCAFFPPFFLASIIYIVLSRLLSIVHLHTTHTCLYSCSCHCRVLLRPFWSFLHLVEFPLASGRDFFAWKCNDNTTNAKRQKYVLSGASVLLSQLLQHTPSSTARHFVTKPKSLTGKQTKQTKQTTPGVHPSLSYGRLRFTEFSQVCSHIARAKREREREVKRTHTSYYY